MSDVAAALRSLDQKTWGAVENAGDIARTFGRDIFPEALEVYAELRGFRGRAMLIYLATKFARVEPDAVNLAVAALQDRSQLVLQEACKLLAVAGQDDTIPALRHLLADQRPEVRDDAQAAIRAIQAKNHNLFVDRDNSGTVTLVISGLLEPE